MAAEPSAPEEAAGQDVAALLEDGNFEWPDWIAEFAQGPDSRESLLADRPQVGAESGAGVQLQPPGQSDHDCNDEDEVRFLEEEALYSSLGIEFDTEAVAGEQAEVHSSAVQARPPDVLRGVHAAGTGASAAANGAEDAHAESTAAVLGAPNGPRAIFKLTESGAPWVPVRESPSRLSKLLAALKPGETVEFLEASGLYGRVEKATAQGKLVSGWAPLSGPGDMRDGKLSMGLAMDMWSPVTSFTLDELVALDQHEPHARAQDLGYGDGVNYWEQRYLSNGEAFDWLGLGLAELSGVLAKAVGEIGLDCRILHVGCGSSELTEQLYDAGFRRVLNIDLSPKVIQDMRERNRDKRPGLAFQVADVTDLSRFKDKRFDMVLDKTLLDTISCSDQRAVAIGAYLAEAWRVLKDDGVLLIITLVSPEVRVPFVEQAPHCDFLVEVIEVRHPSDKDKHGWALLARKGTGGKSIPWPQVRVMLEAGGPPWWGNE